MIFAFVFLAVGYLGVCWWCAAEVRRVRAEMGKATESELFQLGLDLAKAVQERDDAVAALHMLAAEAREIRALATKAKLITEKTKKISEMITEELAK